MTGRFTYRLYDLLTGRRIVPRLDLLLERQTWTPERLRGYIRDRLGELLENATRRVPFYRSGAGAAAPGRLEGFPLLTKDDLRRAGGDLLAEGARRESMEGTTSGGSTGEPVTVYLDRDTCDSQAAAVLRHQTWMGLGLVAPHALLWGPPSDVVTYGSFSGRIKGIPIRRRFFPTFALTRAGAAHIRESLRRQTPDQVIGYSSALDQIATGEDPLRRPVRAVVASAEILYPSQRRRIERFFGAPVFERYGCNEFAALVHQCRLGGRHMNSDRVTMEILRADGRPAEAGQLGEAVITDLDNFGMPLIRYRLGDAVESGGDCSCGLPFPCIAGIHGRMTDLLEGPGGALISPLHVSVALEPCGEMLEHQFTIEENGALTLKVRAAAGFDLATAASVMETLLGRPVRTERAEALERWPSGKVRPVLRRRKPH